MQIEQFDTGLKEQKNFKKLVISQEENYNNKQKIRQYLNTIIRDGKSGLDGNLNKFFHNEVKINCFYPLNEFTTINNFKEKVRLQINAFGFQSIDKFVTLEENIYISMNEKTFNNDEVIVTAQYKKQNVAQ